ncbi:MAG: M23 family metallopeptidase [Mycobacteriales bacterium]
MPDPMHEAQDRLIAYYTQQLGARQRSRKAGHRALAVLGGLVVIAMFLCGGLVPALFPSQENGGGASSALGLSCGVDVADTALPSADPGELSPEQVANATTVVQVGKQLGVPPRGWVVAMATGLQESKLKNLTHRGATNDYDSVGIFQQRPSQGWGTEKQILVPTYSATKFYRKLLSVPDWQRMQLSEAAQAVQRSAFPRAYAKWEPLATHLVLQVSELPAEAAGSSSASSPQPADAAAALRSCVAPGEVSGSGWTAPLRGSLSSGFRAPDRPEHQGVDVLAPRGSTIRAAGPGIVTVAACNASSGSCDVDGSLAVKGCGWYVELDHGGGAVTRYCHMAAQPVVSVGQQIAAGDPLGAVGSSGNSTGAHLHFETRIGDEAVDPTAFLGARGVGLDSKNA